jgi:hypothetical protein
MGHGDRIKKPLALSGVKRAASLGGDTHPKSQKIAKFQSPRSLCRDNLPLREPGVNKFPRFGARRLNIIYTSEAEDAVSGGIPKGDGQRR